jgi:hypothetical protein
VAVVLAVFAVLLSFAFPYGAIVIALAGLAFAIWSIHSPGRRIGIAALVFCCLALAVAMVLGSLELYESIYGSDPLAPVGG